jgi:hypothetical protein
MNNLKQFVFVKSIELPSKTVIKAGTSVIAHENASVITVGEEYVDLGKLAEGIVEKRDVLADHVAITEIIESTDSISESGDFVDPNYVNAVNEQINMWIDYANESDTFVRILCKAMIDEGVLIPEDVRNARPDLVPNHFEVDILEVQINPADEVVDVIIDEPVQNFSGELEVDFDLDNEFTGKDLDIALEVQPANEASIEPIAEPIIEVPAELATRIRKPRQPRNPQA